MLVKIIMVVATLALIVCCILSYKNKEDHKLQTVLLLIVTAVVGMGTILTSLPTTIEVMVPEIQELTKKNDDLEQQNKKLRQQIVDKDSELQEKNEESKALKQSMINNAVFWEYELYYKGEKLISNVAESVAEVNGQLYFSQYVLESLTDEKVNTDSDNKILYLGKYPEKTTELLQACEPYDISDGVEMGKDDPFKIQSKTYAEGIRLTARYDELRSISFNLEGKYTQLSFNIGHIDETEKDNAFTLNVYVDNERQAQIIKTANSSIEEEQVIPLNYGKILRFEWICDNVNYNYNASYGLINLKAK